MPTRTSALAVPATATIPPKPETGWLQRISILVAVLAMVIAVALFWRRQLALDSRAVAPTAEAPAISSATPATPAATPVSPVPPTATTPPPTQESRVAPESPAPTTPQPRPRSATPSETLPGSRGQLPPPPATTPANPARAGGAGAATPPPPSVTPSPTPPAVAPPAPEEVKPQPAPAPVPAAEPVAPPPPAPAQPAPPPPRTAASPEPTATPAATVESDEAAIRRVIRIYERAIETKDIGLYRSVRPNLTRAAETVLTNSFREIDSQEIDIQIENLRIDGRTASARLARRDTLVTAGRRQVRNITQTLRFEKTEAGWFIAE
jgi:hypothetical protein